MRAPPATVAQAAVDPDAVGGRRQRLRRAAERLARPRGPRAASARRRTAARRGRARPSAGRRRCALEQRRRRVRRGVRAREHPGVARRRWPRWRGSRSRPATRPDLDRLARPRLRRPSGRRALDGAARSRRRRRRVFPSRVVGRGHRAGAVAARSAASASPGGSSTSAGGAGSARKRPPGRGRARRRCSSAGRSRSRPTSSAAAVRGDRAPSSGSGSGPGRGLPLSSSGVSTYRQPVARCSAGTRAAGRARGARRPELERRAVDHGRRRRRAGAAGSPTPRPAPPRRAPISFISASAAPSTGCATRPAVAPGRADTAGTMRPRRDRRARARPRAVASARRARSPARAPVAIVSPPVVTVSPSAAACAGGRRARGRKLSRCGQRRAVERSRSTWRPGPQHAGLRARDGAALAPRDQLHPRLAREREAHDQRAARAASVRDPRAAAPAAACVGAGARRLLELHRRRLEQLRVVDRRRVGDELLGRLVGPEGDRALERRVGVARAGVPSV